MSELLLSVTARRVMAIVALIFGLYIVIVGPFLIQLAMDRILSVLVPLSTTDPHFAGPFVYVFSFFFYFYRGIGVVAGILLVIMVYPLWKGKSWAWPVAISCISFPTMLSLISIIPHLAHVHAMPLSAFNVLFGLLAYWIVLLLPKGVKLERVARFSVFTLLGVLGGELSVFVMHNTKEIAQVCAEVIKTLDVSLITDPDVAIIGFALPLNLISLLLCISAIPLLAARNRKGWWFGLIAGIIAMVANYPTQIVRMVTVDFLVAGLFGTLLVVCIIVFKAKLLPEEIKTQSTPS